MCLTNNCNATTEELCDICLEKYSYPGEYQLIVCGICTSVVNIIWSCFDPKRSPLLTEGCSRCTGADDRQVLLAALREYDEERRYRNGQGPEHDAT